MPSSEQCINCGEAGATKLEVGEFNTELFCSWGCLYEYVDVED